MRRQIISLPVALLIAGCASSNSSIPTGVQALPAGSELPYATPPQADYRVGPLDELRIQVFREPELSVDRAVVDAAGMINVPLIGQVEAYGKQVSEIAEDIRVRLNARYLRDAQVAVSLTKATNYVFTVGGEVKTPGTFTIPGRVTLVQALAMGGGLTETAKRADIIIFRKMNGQMHAARFDLREIYSARMADPELRAGDTVIVGTSAAQKIYRDVLQVLPGLAGIFVAIAQNNN